MSDDSAHVEGVRNYVKKKRRNIQHYNSHKITHPDSVQRHFDLGKICIGTTESELPVQFNSISTSISTTEDTESLILLYDRNVKCTVQLEVDVDIVKVLTQGPKQFALEFDKRASNVFVHIFLVQVPFANFRKAHGNCLKMLFELLYDINFQDEYIVPPLEQLKSNEIEALYRRIQLARGPHNEELNKDCIKNVNHPQLRPKLRPYQKDAVNWMILKECQQNANNLGNSLHPLYTEIVLKSNETIYFNRFSGDVQLSKPLINDNSVSGAILADEMGLGKTIEMLACILLNPHHSPPTVENTASPSPLNYDSSSDDDSDPISNFQPKRINRKKTAVSGIRAALQVWYTDCLSETVPKTKRKRPQRRIQCLCGNLTRSRQLQICVCEVCGKKQHAECFAYDTKFGAYKCPQCWADEPKLRTKCTLIVCPQTLQRQWYTEILRHVSGQFAVFQYDGMKKTPVYPARLQDFDIVITTYSVLKYEFRLVDANRRTISLRNERKYSAPICPLTTMFWWRLCLDEAQMMDSPTQLLAIMVQKLETRFRWAVTGTPITKNISDFFGLLNYLQIEPYDELKTWSNLLLGPYLDNNTEPMYKFLSSIMWRTSKCQVLDQIKIPDQRIEEHWLQLSAIEKHFYRCEHFASIDALSRKANLYGRNTVITHLERGQFKHLMNTFSSLRQACSFTNTSNLRYLNTRKPVKSMQELLNALIEKNNRENDEYLRIAVSSLNGLAGIYLLQNDIPKALNRYRQVLKLYERFDKDEDIDSDKNSDGSVSNVKVAIDHLQIIHTIHNLIDVLRLHPMMNNAKLTIKNHSLESFLSQVEYKYCNRFANETLGALGECKNFDKSILDLCDKFHLPPGQWYIDAIKKLCEENYWNELFNRIQNALDNAGITTKVRYQNVQSLMYHLGEWDVTQYELRAALKTSLNDLYEERANTEDTVRISRISIPKRVIDGAAECHLNPDREKQDSRKTNPVCMTKQKCPLCCCNEYLKKYEVRLFSMDKKPICKRIDDGNDYQLTGNWKPVAEEFILKALWSVLKTKLPNELDLIQDGETHLALLETLRKDFKEIRKFWTNLDQQVCSMDELNMCKMRFRLKSEHDDDDEPSRRNWTVRQLSTEIRTNSLRILLLNEYELTYQKCNLEVQYVNMMKALEKNVGLRSYLETLKRQQYQGQNPDPCPICKNDLEKQWAIIPCGHTHCISCIHALVQSTGQPQCPVCRVNFHYNDISYIERNLTDDNVNTNDDSINVKGNFSIKIHSIVQLVLQLMRNEENVKIVIFSKWLDVLKFLSNALQLNNISYELIATANLNKGLYRFKEENTTVLLMPIELGSKGLNLIEATQMILIEPQLMVRDELQAIGRIHRIGQTRRTVVHKFFVRNTIEENIYNAICNDKVDWDSNQVTIEELMNLFKYSEEGENT